MNVRKKKVLGNKAIDKGKQKRLRINLGHPLIDQYQMKSWKRRV